MKLPSGSSCDRPQGYVASPARCVRSMRFRVGPEHNNVFVIYAVDVTLAGNSQAMRRKTSLPQNPEGRIEKRTTDQALAWVLILHYYCHVENGMKMEGVREGSGVYEALLDPDFKLMLVT